MNTILVQLIIIKYFYFMLFFFFFFIQAYHPSQQFFSHIRTEIILPTEVLSTMVLDKVDLVQCNYSFFLLKSLNLYLCPESSPPPPKKKKQKKKTTNNILSVTTARDLFPSWSTPVETLLIWVVTSKPQVIDAYSILYILGVVRLRSTLYIGI